MGFPKNMNNSIGERGQVTLEFKEKIEKSLNVEVIMQDERLTTVEATNYMIEEMCIRDSSNSICYSSDSSTNYTKCYK